MKYKFEVGEEILIISHIHNSYPWVVGKRGEIIEGSSNNNGITYYLVNLGGIYGSVLLHEYEIENVRVIREERLKKLLSHEEI